MRSYLDTSALAKLYLNEPRSDEFEEYLGTLDEPLISTLTLVEMRSLLDRHRRMDHLDRETEDRVFDRFSEDVERRVLFLRPVEDDDVRAAASLLGRFPDIALRTLDALHLSLAAALDVEELATADRTMARAGEELGLRVARFDEGSHGP